MEGCGTISTHNICPNADKQGAQDSKRERYVEYHVEDKWSHLRHIGREHVGCRLLEVVKEKAS